MPSPVLDEALLTVNEVADLLHVPVSWVYEHTRARSTNRIPGFRIGKYWRFREDDILQWIENQKNHVRTLAPTSASDCRDV
jgi:excisionase family DNA binding protein